MMKSTEQGAYDKSLSFEEPDEGKPCPDDFTGFTSGSVVAAGWATAPPTIISPRYNKTVCSL